MTIRTATVLLSVLVTACGGDQLGNAYFENSVDTLTIASIEDTPVAIPSGYSIPDDRLIRTDLTTGFDFVYLARGNRHLLLPLAAVGLGSTSANPGLQSSSATFDAIVNPPSSDYISTDSVEVALGDVLVGRSRLCTLSVPQYAKFEILGFDDAAKTMTFRVVANTNCGFRELGPGLPER